MDDYGYPEDEELARIENWSIRGREDCVELLEYVRGLWTYPEYFEHDEEGTHYTISTGGWSGNESLISAMCSNYMFWAIAWWSSRKGGHYEFKLEKWVKET
jgi:hypothetical protein